MVEVRGAKSGARECRSAFVADGLVAKPRVADEVESVVEPTQADAELAPEDVAEQVVEDRKLALKLVRDELELGSGQGSEVVESEESSGDGRSRRRIFSQFF